MSQFEEKQLEREEIYDGAVLHVVKDKILLPDGNISFREFCLHKGAVAVIPVTDDNEVIMVRQFRYAHHREFLEIPAGKLDFVGEVPLDAVKRELKEETGATARVFAEGESAEKCAVCGKEAGHVIVFARAY